MENFKKKLEELLHYTGRLNLIDKILYTINTKHPDYLKVDVNTPAEYILFAAFCEGCLSSRTFSIDKFGHENFYENITAGNVSSLLGLDPVTATVYALAIKTNYAGEPNHCEYLMHIAGQYQYQTSLGDYVIEALHDIISEIESREKQTNLFGDDTQENTSPMPVPKSLADTWNVPPWV